MADSVCGQLQREAYPFPKGGEATLIRTAASQSRKACFSFDYALLVIVSILIGRHPKSTMDVGSQPGVLDCVAHMCHSRDVALTCHMGPLGWSEQLVATAERVLETFSTDLGRHVRTVQSSLHTPTIEGLNRTVQLLSQSVDKVNSLAGVSEPEAAAVKEGVLCDAVLPVLYWAEGKVDEAAQLLAGSWFAFAGKTITGEMRRSISTKEFTYAVNFKLHFLSSDPKKVRDVTRFYTMALEKWVIEGSGADRGRDQIHLLMTSLRFSLGDLGRMLKVSDETARRWSSGATRIPEGQLARLDLATSGLNRLRRLFRPERLPQVIRRPADRFEGQRALDWILQGRIAEVADRYERDLVYQS